ncbi:MAG: hypothetical protein ACOX3X_09830 [Eubacteriales bacterium]|jgi:hypothetical protein
MKITANAIFETAMGLMGLVGGDGKLTGLTDTLRKNAISCLNTVLAELTGINETITGEFITPLRITTLAQVIECDEYIASVLLPLSLARRLAVGIDPELSAYFKAEYKESLNNVKIRHKAKAENITEVY